MEHKTAIWAFFFFFFFLEIAHSIGFPQPPRLCESDSRTGCSMLAYIMNMDHFLIHKVLQKIRSKEPGNYNYM